MAFSFFKKFARRYKVGLPAGTALASAALGCKCWMADTFFERNE
jgi:hypothetical protein